MPWVYEHSLAHFRTIQARIAPPHPGQLGSYQPYHSIGVSRQRASRAEDSAQLHHLNRQPPPTNRERQDSSLHGSAVDV